VIGVVVIFALLFVAGNITGLVGRFFCLAVPDRAGSAKQLLTISIVLQIAVMACGLLQNLAQVVPGGANPSLTRILWPLEMIFQLSSNLLFLYCCRSIGRFIRRPGLAGDSMSALRYFGIALGCYVVGLVVVVVMVFLGGVGAAAGGRNAVVAAAGSGYCIGSGILVVGAIFGLIAVFKFVFLMKEMSDAVGRYARKIRKKKKVEKGDEEVWEEGEEAGEDDRPRHKRRPVEDEDEEDDDRPRRTRRPVEDEDDDRPRRTRKYEDDEDDDRPRRKRSQEDDEDDDRPRPKRKRKNEDD
jgi:hypothetical protein